jgi:hypothetical protein
VENRAKRMDKEYRQREEARRQATGQRLERERKRAQLEAARAKLTQPEEKQQEMVSAGHLSIATRTALNRGTAPHADPSTKPPLAAVRPVR